MHRKLFRVLVLMPLTFSTAMLSHLDCVSVQPASLFPSFLFLLSSTFGEKLFSHHLCIALCGAGFEPLSGRSAGESAWDFFSCLIDGQDLFLCHISVFYESVFLCRPFQSRLPALTSVRPCLLVNPSVAFITICGSANDRYWCKHLRLAPGYL